MTTLEPRVQLSRERFDAVMFDLDGVITRTARVHAAAWKKLFDEFLQEWKPGDPWDPFDIERDYRTYVDGKPRYEGVKSFLESRGIRLPYGTPGDSPDLVTVCGIGNRKNRLFREALEEMGVEVDSFAVRLLGLLRKNGFTIAVVSSSKNCQAVIRKAGIESLFDVRVDGTHVEELGLEGKPHPDIFLEAARRLGVLPERSVVVEDAIAGVKAGRKGGFGLVVGMDRADARQGLLENGADVVLDSLDAISVKDERGGAQ